MRKIKQERRPEILDAALRLSEERGLAAVSMRAVAADIGLTPMALYGYFEGKEALLDGLVGRLLRELPLPGSEPDPRTDTDTDTDPGSRPDRDPDHGSAPAPGPDSGWRDRLLACARGARALAHRYPRTFPLLLDRPAELPEAMRVVDALYAALLDAGVPDAQVAALERMISTFVLGFAVSEVNGRFGEGSLGTRGRRGLADPRQVPAHHRLGEVLDRPVDWDAEFEEGLGRLLEVVERSAAPRAHG
ncbi:TetR/AcrR family transcriptional regulator [Nocardiopsis alborubida]|uniref:TetR/AcrR family transcriptional regulator n=1 Tax=Nocardiopsis alborubida TaxID=146802 RepID=UPI001B349841|nr:TetR/AcrR family transcriptional regulator [Nocardiopsis alborubida]